MRSWIFKQWHGDSGVYARYLCSLLLIVTGVFAYFSVTGCGEPVNNGCGPGGQSGTSSSAYTYSSSVSSPPYNFSMSGTGSATLQNDSVPLSGAVLPGSQVTRYISYTAEAGKGPTRLEWTPPQGASGFSFSAPPTNPSGPAPYVFGNDPPIGLPLQITYNAPLLPAYTSTMVVGEVLAGTRVSETDDIHVLNYTISATASESQATPPFVPATSMRISDLALAATITASQVQRWYWLEGITLTTETCQQMYDWLQSPSTFTAMRMPVSATSMSGLSYELPVLFPVDSNPITTVIGARPRMNVRANGSPIAGIPDLPLEVRSERISFMENLLPSAPAEHWVALGVAPEPKITCPTGMSKASWEFNFAFSIHPDSPIAALPLYYCQDGQDAPPIGGLASALLVGQQGVKAVPSTQFEGITCLGPQEHSLATNPAIYVGNPNTVWNVFPQDEVRLMHYVVVTNTLAIRFSVSSGTAGFGWELYEGTVKTANFAKPVDVTIPYTASFGYSFFWLIGTVPTGTIPGSHNFTLRVEKADDSSVYGSSTDMVWVGQWVPPPTPGGTKHYVHLPLVIRQ
jgi:hypothetical protein